MVFELPAKMSFLVFVLMVFLAPGTLTAQTQGTFPLWVDLTREQGKVLSLEIPGQLNAALPRNRDLDFLLLSLDEQWSPDWKQASFDLKNLIVTIKTRGLRVRVGLEGTPTQIDGLMAHELAPYIDGYLFEEDPFIPDGDETGKLWQNVHPQETRVLTTLIDAASMGIEVVLFVDTPISDAHKTFLDFVAGTPTGSLDLQPEIRGIGKDEAQFFLDPKSGNYHLALYAPLDREVTVVFNLASGLKVSRLYPDKARFRHLQYGKRTELRLFGEAARYFFLLEPKERGGTLETLEIIGRETIDPYELVVKNQVFKDGEQQKFRSLTVDELQNYRYQTPGGIAIDVTYNDTVVIRKNEPVERIRRELYLAGVKWRKKKMPELPLIQPEKVQTVPLEVDLDKSYQYAYLGEDTVNGRQTWKVRFEPKQAGDYLAGTVWIDKETGAHHKIRAIQSGLEPPVTGNEITAIFGWVEDGGERYWTQVEEHNLQILTVAGLRLALQIHATRSNFRFNRDDVKTVLDNAYQSDAVIMRDTAQGFRYLKKKDGKRVVSEDVFASQKALVGGLFIDPARETSIIPLGGFNYTHLDFLGKGWQANFFLAGALNDLIISNPDFLGKGWDLTAELFLTAITFSDRIFEGGNEREDLELEKLRESVNITLGIPLNSFFKFQSNYSFRYLDYQAASDTADEYVIPSTTFEHIGRFTLQYSRQRFSTELEYEIVKRTDWEPFGFPNDPEPLEDTYSSLRFDAGISKRLPKFQTISADVRYLKGWNQDRFSRFSFGFFENRVSGFGSSGAEGNEAVRLELGYDIGISGIFNLNLQLDGARAWMDEAAASGFTLSQEPVDLIGVGLAANLLGPWGTLIRLDLGYGITSDLEGEEGEISGQLVFLKLF